MSFSFDKNNENEEKKVQYQKQLCNLTGNTIFCPKCGVRNYFEIKDSSDYLCTNCSSKLNVYWDTYVQGYLMIDYCPYCKELTFKDLEFCISCGLSKLDKNKRPIIHQEPLFITIKSDTLYEYLNQGKYYKVLNPKHHKAKKIKLFALICFLSWIVLSIIIVLVLKFNLEI